MTIVIGEISYTNILPFFFHLNHKVLEEQQYRFVPQVPSQLNAEMAAGRVDVGGISSFAYAENPEKYTLLPNLSVSSQGKVGSIFLFSRYPLAELSGKRIALTSSSATSIHLLKIILQHFLKYENDYSTMNPNIDVMLESHDACLLIGDDAIRASWTKGPFLYQYDLGALWYEHTGLSMTYAVFAVRNEKMIDEPIKIAGLQQAFLNSKNESIRLEHAPMIQEIMAVIGGGKQFWETYFSGLRYDFGVKEQEGLRYYYQLAHQCGFLRKSVETIHVWDSVHQ
ncbi:menaquinone biosynthesis protein [Bacillus solitudinis]|uniref:menaquinone biosynthesis protein n=1 Tax=Bacillus solitudinis TaxID=2014074 RepID=UPI000C23DA6E|nr:menaquinone biosynthesis protein [Bacillus solitudinis]